MRNVTADTRRHDLDWLRILAISLLIITHILYGYGIDSHYRFVSTHQGHWSDLLRLIMQPWRMSLIFFIAGAAARFMLDKLSPGAFIQNRALRLLVPFLFGMAVIVPVCQYLTEAGVPGSGFPEPILHFLLTKTLHVQKIFGVWMPEAIHVWFLLYVFVYAVIAGLVWRRAPRTIATLGRWVEALPVWCVLAGMAGVFVLTDAVIGPRMPPTETPQTSMLINDPIGVIRSVVPFVLGLFVARPSPFWARLRGAVVWLVPAGVITLAAALGLTIFTLVYDGEAIPHITFYLNLAPALYGAVMLLLVLSLASHFLNHPAPAYLSDAIMPVYLLHETVMIGAGVVIVGLHLPLIVELPVIYLASMLIPLLVYHVAIRPWPAARFLFGMKMHAAKRREPSPPVSPTLSPTA